MECAIVNMVEPGDKVLVFVTGYFGLRMVDMAKRAGGEYDSSYLLRHYVSSFSDRILNRIDAGRTALR